jgi:hypothetical protein
VTADRSLRVYVECFELLRLFHLPCVLVWWHGLGKFLDPGTDVQPYQDALGNGHSAQLSEITLLTTHRSLLFAHASTQISPSQRRPSSAHMEVSLAHIHSPRDQH